MKRINILFACLLAWCASFAAAPANVDWSVSVDSLSPASGAIVWKADIHDGWHIYGMEMPKELDIPITLTSFTVNASEGVELVGTVTPSRTSETHFDAIMNADIPWWEGSVEFRQEFKLKGDVKGASFSGEYSYMACNATACTRPMTREYSLVFGNSAAVVPADSQAAGMQNSASTASADQSAQSAQKLNAEWWAPVDAEFNYEIAQSWWGILGMGFLGGLLALLTPCVWPMIPMTVSFFLKTSKNRRRSIANASMYGLSIIVIFLALGLAITAIFGASKLNELATSAVFNIVLFVLLVIFAISFLGAFEIKLPSKWSNAIDSKAESTSGIVSIFFMALTLVLVSFSCTGPIIGTLLVEAASEGNIVGPALGMGGFALGLALPFTLFAIFPSFLQSMPKSGGWLNSVKVVLGFIELILSLKFLSVADLAYGWRILDREVFVAIWIVLFILLGLYLLGKLRFSHDGPSEHTSVLGFFLAVISLSFSVYLVPGLWGAPLKAISAFAPPLFTQDFNLYGGEYHEFDDYDAGMEYALKNNKPVIVDFTGYGCVNCRKMEMAVFDMPEVRDKIENDFVLIKIYVDDKTPLAHPYTIDNDGETINIRTVGDKWSYLQEHKFGISSQPYYVQLNNKGELINTPRVYDENVSEFMKWLNEGYTRYESEL